MKDSFDDILLKANLVKKNFETEELIHTVEDIKKNLLNLFPHIIESNKIDLKHNNGFLVDLETINSLIKNFKEEKVFGTVSESKKSEDKKIMYGKQIMDKGTGIIINDGNTYVIIELLLKNILAGNSIIFVNKGFLYGTNSFMIKIVQDILEVNHIDKNLVQLYITEDYDEVLRNYANIDFVIGVGDRRLQQEVLEKSKNPTIVSGYENFNLYLEEKKDIEFINTILKETPNINLYIKEGIGLDHPKAMLVADIEEAIAQINYTGSNYASSIITNNPENSRKFVSEIKSSIVTVNTSPTIERVIDIKQEDLVIEKTIITPLNFETKKEN